MQEPKRIFHIETGKLSKEDAEKYIKDIIKKYKNSPLSTTLSSICNEDQSIEEAENFWI